MRKFLIYISNRHEAILKGILIALTVGLITWLLPHKPRYKFDFQVGKVWNNDDLTAPFDFTIQKNPDSLKAEIIRVKKMVPLYYRKDTSVAGLVRKTLSAQLVSEMQDKDPAIAQKAVDLFVTDVYKAGLFSRDGVADKGAGKIVILKGSSGITVYSGDVFTFERAGLLCAALFTDLDASARDKWCSRVLSTLKPDLVFDKQLTEKMREQEGSTVLATMGVVLKGELIVSRGQLVDQSVYQKLTSLKARTEANGGESVPVRGLVTGQILLILVSLSMLLLFLALLRKDIFHDNRKLALLFLVMILFTGVYAKVLQTTLSTLVVPLCILPIIIRVFFDTRLALFTHVITVLILGSVAPNGYEFIFMQVVAGMVTIFSVTNMRRRSQLFISAGMIFVAYLICYLAISITHAGGLHGIDTMSIAWLGGNVMLTLFAYPLIYVFEKIFNLISDISLMELADTNTPLLRELSMKAPGTFQHSMQVANLAEEAVFRIGGNALLVRVGALYHDIGKMEMPLYFIENQVTGVNPHDEISFEESASIIIGHVISGIEIARKNKLPDLVIDFIRTHHGTTMVQYFYQSFLKNFPDEIVDEEAFRYPGPLPFSKETAVLMMADSVEASARSLPKHDADTINRLVDDIIDRQIEAQQYINSDITFRDISIIKKMFKKMLMSIYHVRVEYPRT